MQRDLTTRLPQIGLTPVFARCFAIRSLTPQKAPSGIVVWERQESRIRGTMRDARNDPFHEKRRLARFRRTAVPNRRPITMPSIASENIFGQNCRLNHPVETRRPVLLIRSMSELRLRKNDTGLCPCVMNSPACPSSLFGSCLRVAPGLLSRLSTR